MKRALWLILLLLSPIWGQDFVLPEDEQETGRSIPKLTGLSIEDAEQRLAAITKNYEIMRIPSQSPPGVVFRQQPAPGGSLRKDKPALLFVTAPLPLEKKDAKADQELPDQAPSEPNTLPKKMEQFHKK